MVNKVEYNILIAWIKY